MITGVLLAAGRGERFGGDKLRALLPDGQSVAAASAGAMVAALARVIAVVRPGDDELADLLARAGAEVVVCRHAEQGMGASLACGIAAAGDADGWVIALADMPWIRPATIRAVAEQLDNGAVIVSPSHGGRRGHPVGFAGSLGGELRALGGDEGARSVVHAHRDQRVEVPTEDPGILRDVDTPADLADP